MGRILQVVLLILIVGAVNHSGFAQVTLGASPYAQDFNSVGSGLPVGWSVRTAATASALGTTGALVTAATAWNSMTGNFRNVASATGLTSTSDATAQSASTNRALAVRQIGGTDTGVAFILQLANTSGLSNFSLDFKLQSLDNTSPRKATWTVDYGIGSTPSSFSTVATSPTPITTGNSTWASTNVSVNFGNAINNQLGNVWIRIVVLSPTSGSGNRPTSAIDDVNLSFIAAPTFTASYPKLSNYFTDGFNLKTSISAQGKSYFVVLPDGATTPSAAQVKAGQNASGTPLTTNLFGSIVSALALTEYGSAITGLNSDTEYDIYVVAEDNVGNIQGIPTKVNAKTNVVGDVTAPVFTSTYPKITSVATTTFSLATNLDEQGRTYFVIFAGGAAAPTSAQVKAHQNGNGDAVASGSFGTIEVTSGSTEFTTLITGLNTNTQYDVYLVSEDNVPNLGLNPIKITATTLKLFSEDFDTCNGDVSSFTQVSVTGSQTWACSSFGNNSTNGIQINAGTATGSTINEDWLISPSLTISADAMLTFSNRKEFQGDDILLKISADYAVGSLPSSASWSDLSFTKSTGAWVSSGAIDLSSYLGQKVNIAFVYTSGDVANSGARWTIDDVSIVGTLGNYFTTSKTGLLFSVAGDVKTYAVKSFNLTSDVVITAPSNFEVSKGNPTFSGSISFTAVEANANPTVYVKFTGPGTDTYAGSITHTSTGVASRAVSVTGVDKSKSFNITAYNLEFFGADVVGTGGEFGPADDPLQIANVTTVLKTIGSDIFSVEEVSNDDAMNTLVSNLPGYNKIFADKWSYYFDPSKFINFPPQKIGFVYNSAKVNVISSRVMFAKLYDDIRAASPAAAAVLLPGYPTSDGNTPDNFWSSGRLPFMVTADVTVNSVKKRVRFIVIHAKSGSAQADYDRRKYDVQVLHDSLVANYPNDNIMIMGDFNDDVDTSINTGSPSSYKMFVDDAANFNVLTYGISQAGAFSFPSSSSFLDHIIISNELSTSYVANSILVDDPRTYIMSYTATTSDHLPVSARFALNVQGPQTITFSTLPAKNYGDAAFNLTATSTSGLAISYASSDASIASVDASGKVTIKKAGTVNITASQAGDSGYLAATDVVRALTINKASQTITFTAPATKTAGDAAFSLSATSTSTLAVSFTTTNTDKVTVSGSQVTIVKAGSVTISANQAGNESYSAATAVNQTFCINPAKPTVTVSGVNTESPTLTSSASVGNQWYLNNTAITGATNATLSATAAGIYKVQVKADNCVSAFSTDTPLIVTGDLKKVNEEISVYPNPVDDYLMIAGLKPEIAECFITDMTGRTYILKLESQNGTHRGDVKGYSTGLYLARVQSGNTVQQVKFIKK